MAAVLYEKLSDTSVIPVQYTNLRLIIDHYAEDNDGYAVLHELLEDSHPGMQKDPLISQPTSMDFNNNLQLYATKFMAWITAESLDNQIYPERQQVYRFLQGLDEEFQPAILYIHTLMDAWGKDGLNPKCEIRTLPRTIEDYQHKHGNQTHIRKLQGDAVSSEKLLSCSDDINQHISSTDTAIAHYASNTKGKSSTTSNLFWIHVPQLTYTVAVAVGMDIESLTVISRPSY
jgi:hypothetical protein